MTVGLDFVNLSPELSRRAVCWLLVDTGLRVVQKKEKILIFIKSMQHIDMNITTHFDLYIALA